MGDLDGGANMDDMWRLTYTDYLRQPCDLRYESEAEVRRAAAGGGVVERWDGEQWVPAD